MKTTLTVVTKNGGRRLGLCLKHLEEMDVDDEIEIFLVDDHSNDGVSLQIMQDYADKSRFDVKIRKTTKAGHNAGRNIAMREAAGDIQISIDDDCYADVNFVREWRKVFEAHPDLGYASGMVARYDLNYSDLGCVETPYERHIEPRSFAPRGFIQGSNMAFRTECLNEIGRFNEDLGMQPGPNFAGEEWDLSLRACNAGYAGGYFPAPKVAHDHRRSGKVNTQRIRYYDAGGGYVYAKHTLTRAWFRTLHEFGHEMKKMWRAGERDRFWTFARGYIAYFLPFMRKRWAERQQ